MSRSYKELDTTSRLVLFVEIYIYVSPIRVVILEIGQIEALAINCGTVRAFLENLGRSHFYAPLSSQSF